MLRRVRFVAVLALTLIVVAGGTFLWLTKRDLLAAYADGGSMPIVPRRSADCPSGT